MPGVMSLNRRSRNVGAGGPKPKSSLVRIVVLDGATARTGTGCVHGIAWYAAKLGSALAGLAADRESELANALMYGIRFTADQHRDTCDLSHPGARRQPRRC